VIRQRERFDAPSRPFFLAAGVPVPAAPDGRLNVTQAWEWSSIDDQSALLRLAYDASGALQLFAHAGGARTQVDRLFGTPTVTSAAGDVSTRPQRFQFDIHRATAEAGVRGRFATGPVQHTVTLQATQYRDRLERGSVNGTTLATHLYVPADHPAQAVAAPATVPRVSASELTGVALADTLALLDRRVLVVLGVREQQVKSDNFDATTGSVAQRYDRSATTPLAALIVKPGHDVSLYANVAEGLSKGDVAPSTASNAGEVLPPYKSRQVEVGARLERGALTASASLFQITKPSGQMTGTMFAADAEQRNRGVELNAMAERAAGLRVLGGITWIEAEITRSSNAALLGKRPVGVPRVQAHIGAEWDLGLVRGLTLTGAVFHAGRQDVDAANTRSIPSWTRLDLGVRYATTIAGQLTTFRALLRNAADRDHWSGVSSFGGLAQGAPRTVQLSATVDL
jgi:iron complex outermembrane receptor protein